jgi:peptidoglycan/xylan/chitin deacetylase (PgdA/CDA1 family)
MKLAFKILRYSGLAFFFREYFQRNKLSILMFHDIDRKTAKQSFEYLAKKYNIISLQTYLQARQSGDLKALPSKAMIITFDDGHKQNYEIYPILQSLGVPATIFLCSGIVDTYRHYWFMENKTGQSTDSLKKLNHQERLQQLDAAGFHLEKEFEHRPAWTSEEILEMKSAIDFQGHTVFHPCLPTCTPS